VLSSEPSRLFPQQRDRRSLCVAFVTSTLKFAFCYRVSRFENLLPRRGNNILIIPILLPPRLQLGAQQTRLRGGIAIAEALKINETITNIK
jgi:hypothetical protein